MLAEKKNVNFGQKDLIPYFRINKKFELIEVAGV